jgi:5-methylcytosine-specific restriction endonuclease McrA
MRTKKWTEKDLRVAVKNSKSYREVIKQLGLIPAGGNYTQVKEHIKKYSVSVSHFTFKGWRKNLKIPVVSAKPIEEVLTKNSSIQSFKLKNRLFKLGLKKQSCELCNWSKRSLDGRIPVELDHINGDRTDNRIENLRILCPNCHSLQSTHRGLNKKRSDGGIGIHATLKML